MSNASDIHTGHTYRFPFTATPGCYCPYQIFIINVTRWRGIEMPQRRRLNTRKLIALARSCSTSILPHARLIDLKKGILHDSMGLSTDTSDLRVSCKRERKIRTTIIVRTSMFLVTNKGDDKATTVISDYYEYFQRHSLKNNKIGIIINLVITYHT